MPRKGEKSNLAQAFKPLTPAQKEALKEANQNRIEQEAAKKELTADSPPSLPHAHIYTPSVENLNQLRPELIAAQDQIQKWSKRLAGINNDEVRNISLSMAAYAVGLSKVIHG